MVKTISAADGTKQVDTFLEALDHPLKSEVQQVREIIKGANKNVTEQIKWNAPSFSYNGEYLVTFNLRPTDRIHLVFHNPMISKVKSKLLEGDYKDRRMAYFANMQEIQAKRAVLAKALKDLIKFQEALNA
jgi:uncharacterized protein YdhG (YjbR/CyaY superfamily)